VRAGTLKTWLIWLVIVHLGVAILHGTAHNGAGVGLTPAANTFVLIVIVIGPVVGLGLTFLGPRLGAGVIAATMAGSLLFGIINHFVLDSADHVMRVHPDWRTLFGATAALLAVLEGSGTIVGALAAFRAKGSR
jgi:hypothetical protein